MNMTHLLSNSIGQAMGWTLIHSLWEGAVIATLVLAGVARTRSAERRYLVYGFGMAALLVSLLATFLVQMQGRNAGAEFTATRPAIVLLDQKASSTLPASGGPNSKGTVTWDQLAPGVGGLWMAGVAVMGLRAGAAA